MSRRGRALSARDPGVAVRTLVVAAAAIAPIIVDIGAIKPFDIIKSTAVVFLGSLALGVWLAAVIAKRMQIHHHPMALLAVAFLIANLVSTSLSPTPWISVFGWYGRYGGLVTLVVLVAFFHVVASAYAARRHRVPELVFALGGGALAVSAYIWIQRLGLDPIDWTRPGEGAIQPFFGTMGNANFAGGFLALTSPWLYLAYTRSRTRRQRYLLAAAASAQLGALWFTGARNGIIGLAAVAGVLLFAHRKAVPLVLKAGAVVLALSAVTLAVIVIWHPGSDQTPRALRRVDILRSETLEVRWHWWVAGARMFADRPITGWGPDTFVTKYHSFADQRTGAIPEGETADKPHNVYVEHAAHTGLVGLIPFVGLLALGLRQALSRARSSNERERHTAIALAAMLAGYSGQAFFSIDVAPIGLALWVVLGAIAALDISARKVAEPVPHRRKLSARTSALAGTTLLVFSTLAGFSTRAIAADHRAKDAIELATTEGGFWDVVELHDDAIAMHPFDPQYRGVAGNYLETAGLKATDLAEKRARLSEAVTRFREMVDLHPDYHLWRLKLARALALYAPLGGDTYEEAEAEFAEAAKLSPIDWRVPTLRGEARKLWGDITKDRDSRRELFCRALSDFNEAISIRNWAKGAWLGRANAQASLGRIDDAISSIEHALQIPDEPERDEALLTSLREIRKLDRDRDPVDCN